MFDKIYKYGVKLVNCYPLHPAILRRSSNKYTRLGAAGDRRIAWSAAVRQTIALPALVTDLWAAVILGNGPTYSRPGDVGRLTRGDPGRPGRPMQHTVSGGKP